MEYHFSISDYSSSAVRGMLLWAIGGCVVIGFVIIKETVTAIRNKGVEYTVMSVWEKIVFLFRYLWPLVGVLVFFFFRTWPTFQYSRYLPFESAEDVIYSSGIIEDVAPVRFAPRFNIGDDPKSYEASIVTIDGEEYFFLTADGLQKHQPIDFSFLPRSRMVLDCIQQRPDGEPILAETQTEPIEEQDSFNIPKPTTAQIVMLSATCVLLVGVSIYAFIMIKQYKKTRAVWYGEETEKQSKTSRKAGKK